MRLSTPGIGKECGSTFGANRSLYQGLFLAPHTTAQAVKTAAFAARMMELLGGSATPMGFGDVYTALQSQMLDGAENNELALTDNGHGDVCKYYSYTMHQMIPDILIGNLDFMESLSEEERAIFDEGFQILNQTQRDAWETAVEEAKNTAENEQGVTFLYPDITPFQEAVAPMHQEMLENYPDLAPIYELIQAHNAEYPAESQ